MSAEAVEVTAYFFHVYWYVAGSLGAVYEHETVGVLGFYFPHYFFHGVDAAQYIGDVLECDEACGGCHGAQDVVRGERHVFGWRSNCKLQSVAFCNPEPWHGVGVVLQYCANDPVPLFPVDEGFCELESAVSGR